MENAFVVAKIEPAPCSYFGPSLARHIAAIDYRAGHSLTSTYFKTKKAANGGLFSR
jgi:hypothetical protein